MFRFFLNNTLVDDPINWDEFQEVIDRDTNVRGLLVKNESTLKFNDKGYKILSDLKTQGGYCQLVPIVMQQDCGNGFENILTGNIRLSAVEFNRSKCTADCEVEDNSYSAMIYNNRKLEAQLNAGFSKNGEAITPCTALSSFRLREPATNTIGGATGLLVYDVGDAFEFLIAYMTDGQVGFVSDWYSSLPNGEKIGIVTGEELRLFQHEVIPNISFQDLFDEMHKKFNIAFAMEEDSTGAPIMRIEPTNYFFKAGVAFNMPNIPELIETVDVLSLYSQVKVGDNNAAKYDPTIHSLPPVQFLSFQKEDYAIQGQCNIDRELGIISDWIIDSNVIEGLGFTDQLNDDYDEDIVMLQYEVLPSGLAHSTVMWNDLFAQPPVFFNELLKNNKASERFDVQGDIAKYLGDGNDGFQAERTTAGSVITILNLGSYVPEPFPFNNDATPPNNDPNNNYDSALYRYTAPVDGVYSFENIMKWSYLAVDTGDYYMLFEAKRYDAAGVLLESRQINGHIHPELTTGSFTDIFNYSFYLEATDYVQIYAVITFVPGSGPLALTFQWQMDAGSIFRTTQVSNGGGIYQVKDAAAYNVSRFLFSYPINNQDWQGLKADPAQALEFGENQISRRGWVNRITRTLATSLSEVELISNIDNSG